MQTWFPYFFDIDLHAYSALHGKFSFGMTSGPVDQQRKQPAVRFCSRWYIMRSGVGILARQIWLAMTYGFDQVIFIVWIKFFPFEKQFS